MEALEGSMGSLTSTTIRRLPHNRSHSSVLSVLPNEFLSIGRRKPSLLGCSLKLQGSFPRCNPLQAVFSTKSPPPQEYYDDEIKERRDLTGAEAQSDDDRRRNRWIQDVRFGTTGNGWTGADGKLNERLLGNFRGLTLAAEDRVEVHSILAKQRDNWNHLFHSTIVIAIVSAAASAAINGAEPALGLTMVSSILNFTCAAVMALVNNFQPSQLAEEQRRAARFFKRLIVEVEATLQIEPGMREEASEYWKTKVGTLHALDVAFPLPLAPQGLKKFPKQVLPSELSCPRDLTDDKTSESDIRDATGFGGGWTKKTEDYLKEVSMRLQNRDVPQMIDTAKKARGLNLTMARTSPVLALAAAACSIANIVPATASVSMQLPWLAATLSVGALFAHSTSHALQLGGGFEMYRNYAGYYEDIKNTLEKVLDLPVNKREDGILLQERIDLQLGHFPLDPKEVDKDIDCRAGKLF